ncbi:MAG: SprB repeat-containing protein, partial [Ignavibacteria bacterium]|nr:SprB repeat-containing protein [Ignavibacteria bacterium]
AENIQWKLIGPQSSNSNENIFAFYFILPGKYILTLLAENKTGKDSTYLELVINPLPVVIIHSTPVSNPKSNDGSLVTEVKGGTSPYAFSWSNGSTIANQQNIFAGNYDVTVTDYKGCTAPASATISIGSGELNLFHTAGINIYPYISEHKVDVEWIKHLAKIEFVLMNFTGQIIKQYQYIETDNGSMAFNNMVDGFYVLKIITDEEVMIRKLIF